jgi:hypothetical protein
MFDLPGRMEGTGSSPAPDRTARADFDSGVTILEFFGDPRDTIVGHGKYGRRRRRAD